MRRYISNFFITFIAAALLVACGSRDKGPAETALKAAEEAINTMKGEASKYLPDQVSALDASLATTKDKFAKGDYQAVLSDAPALTAKAQEVASAAAAKKAELTKSWENMSAGMPRVVEAIKSRVDILSQSKKLPAGMSKETLDQARTGLSEITQQWTAATEAAKGGNLADAAAKASSAKVKAAEVLTLLKMPVPEALKS
ncbi:MAG TPA: hypothetical protein VGH22_23725 [Candidatus Binatia bacterium]|jgi:hypothetical protein